MAKALARPIRSRRDHKRAAVASKTLQQAEREPVAERRLQALLAEIEKFDGEADEEQSYDDATGEDVDGEYRRRWSDDA